MNNVRPIQYGSTLTMPNNGTNLGRDKLPWSQEIWDRIDQAVHEECKRTKIARKFLPLYGPVAPGELTVPSDTIVVDVVDAAGNRRTLAAQDAPVPIPSEPLSRTLIVEEARTTALVELLVEFTLTAQQVAREAELMTAVTLATRAANFLSQAEDVVLFQGQKAIDPGADQHPLFKDKKVRARSGPAGIGLLNAPPAPDPQKPPSTARVIRVPPIKEAPGPRWGENTFEAVADAYSRLQRGEGMDQAHYGPYALVLRTEPYADTYAPVLTNHAEIPNTLVITADRIRPLVTAGYCGTGTLPPLRGILVSLGGNTMDFVVGMDATTAFLQEDTEGRYRFRVYERFALRLKDATSVIRLEFLTKIGKKVEGNSGSEQTTDNDSADESTEIQTSG